MIMMMLKMIMMLTMTMTKMVLWFSSNQATTQQLTYYSIIVVIPSCIFHNSQLARVIQSLRFGSIRCCSCCFAWLQSNALFNEWFQWPRDKKWGMNAWYNFKIDICSTRWGQKFCFKPKTQYLLPPLSFSKTDDEIRRSSPAVVLKFVMSLVFRGTVWV